MKNIIGFIVALATLVLLIIGCWRWRELKNLNKPKQTEKKDSDAKQVEKLLNDMGCDVKVASVGWSEKEVVSRPKERVGGDVSVRGNNLTTDSKLPELDCSECKFSFGHYNSYCSHKGLCLHGDKFEPKEKLPEPNLCDSCKLWVANFDPEGNECENYMKEGCPKLKEKTEPEKYPKVVYQLGSDSKEYMELKEKYDKLIEGFIKFIDRFEGRYEGNICGECLEYWKTIKEHYKGV